jgi:hypothetical protein
MKKNLLFLFFFLGSVPLVSFAQESEPRLQYAIGGGASIDGNNLLWGLHISNELNYRLGRKTSLNLGVSFYQSLGNLENRAVNGFAKSINQSSGIFITPSLRYDILQRDSGFKLSFGAGPSLQLGGEAFRTRNIINTADPIPMTFVNKNQRIGLLLELEAEWKTKNPNVRNALAISAYGADYYFPWFINATYKVRFNVERK